MEFQEFQALMRKIMRRVLGVSNPNKENNEKSEWSFRSS
jgi:hypothetical protein